VALLLTYVFLFPSIPFVQFFASTGSEFAYMRAITALTLAPLVETLIFQALVIYLTGKFLLPDMLFISGIEGGKMLHELSFLCTLKVIQLHLL
jgi:hypothetical protein